MSVKKQYIKSSGLCKCTFRLPKAAAANAQKVALVGDFNEWEKDGVPMKKLKSGEFKVDVELEPGRQYEFRYLIDEESWENDWDADAYVPKPAFFVENSMIAL